MCAAKYSCLNKNAYLLLQCCASIFVWILVFELIVVTRPGLGLCGPMGNIIAQGRPSFAAQSLFTPEDQLKVFRSPNGQVPASPLQSGPAWF
jgi:hypothetical protein